MGGKAIKRWSEEDKAWLRSRFEVNCDTGEVFYKDGSPSLICKINPSRKQYLAVSALIGGKWTKIRLHHLVWFFKTGEQSLKMIDHKEPLQDTLWGNRFENLRQCTDKQNRANVARKGYSIIKDKTGIIIGYQAVMRYKCSKTGKLLTKRSRIFSEPEMAQTIYWSWQRKHHKEFAFKSGESYEAV